jgi:hypothetical protein
MSALVIFGGFGGVCPLVVIRFYPVSVELGLPGSVVSGQTSVIQSPKLGARNMRYELADHEWIAIKPMLPNKPRGVPRVNDRRVLMARLVTVMDRMPSSLQRAHRVRGCRARPSTQRVRLPKATRALSRRPNAGLRTRFGLTDN